MNKYSIAAILSGLLVCFVVVGVPGISAQSGGNYKVDADWAQLPQGTTWNGNTTWIAADGKGNVLVLVRTAPYFRLFTRDGKFVKSFGDDGLFQSAHSVTIDSQGFLWVTRLRRPRRAQVQPRRASSDDPRQEGRRRR